MATKRNTLTKRPWFWTASEPYVYYRVQEGWNGDHRSVYPYKGYEATSFGFQRNTVNNTYRAVSAVGPPSVARFNNSGGIPDGAQYAYNKAYARFREAAIGEASQLGVAFAEWRESLGMITNRALGLARAARALKKGNLKDALKHLGVPPKRKHKGKVKNAAHQASSLWLEYWFGWSASLSDIYSAMQVLGGPLPYGPAVGSAAHRYRSDESTKNERRIYTGKVRFRIQADVLLTNPNLFLLNQLGLLNPATIAWESIPFSFMVDWIADVGSYLESFTDFIGVELLNPSSTFLLQFEDEVTWLQPYMTPARCTASGHAMIRKDVIPRPIPNLNVFGNLGQSLTRTASAVSLLTQTLLSMKA